MIHAGETRQITPIMLRTTTILLRTAEMEILQNITEYSLMENREKQ